MENEIKKLIDFWKENAIDESRLVYISDTSKTIIKQLQSLIEFKQNNCCSKQIPSGIKEVYEKYKHLDGILSDKQWFAPYENMPSPVHNIVCYELWSVIKNECA